jgi:hypothetical protein
MVNTKTLCPSKNYSKCTCSGSLKAMEMKRDGSQQYT